MLPFVTAYDPIGGSSGSIDPLGALQTYGTLADLLLPGITTITTRSRYLSMLCAALANAEEFRRLLPGASGLAQRRKAVEPFERLWAVACVAAREEGNEGAADGLRGITYAEDKYRNFLTNGGKVNCDFRLLKFQSRTGAVGTYWTALVAGQLVHADSGSLSQEGQELADQFPELPLVEKDRAKLADPESARRVSLSLDELITWSERSHLRAAGHTERRALGEALTADDRRECVSRALVLMKDNIPANWDTDALGRLGKIVATLSPAAALGLHVVIDAIIVTEQFHEAVLALFETLLWWGTKNASQSIGDLTSDRDFRKTADRCHETAKKLRTFYEDCSCRDIRDAVESLVRWCCQIERCRSERELVTEVLDRHHRVQSGKMDGGMPKRDWIALDGPGLLRPSPRFQRINRPDLALGRSLTHPYRLEPFVYMLRENGAIPVNE